MNVKLVVDQVVSSLQYNTLLDTGRRRNQCWRIFEYKYEDSIKKENVCCDDNLSLAERLGIMATVVSNFPTVPRNPDRPRKQGLWHLFTNCHGPRGNLGKAYYDTLCHSQYGVGVSALAQNKEDDFWITFLHEVGHNLNASHSHEEGVGSTGGVMDFTHVPLDGEIQFNSQYRKDEMCSALNSRVSTCAMVSTVNPRCGDQVVEGQEECECADGSQTCLFCHNCRLSPGKQCNPSEECCSGDGAFLASMSPCSIGRCVSGKCMDTHKMCESWFHEGSTECGDRNNPCRVQCTSTEGTCKRKMLFPAGTVCGSNQETCDVDGLCKVHPPSPPLAVNKCGNSPKYWFDSDGPKFDCAYYRIHNKCDSIGYRFRNFGKTAQEACCACGGGMMGTLSPSPYPTTHYPTIPPPTSPTLPDIVSLLPTSSPSVYPSSPPSFSDTTCVTPARTRKCAKARNAKACKRKSKRNAKCQWCGSSCKAAASPEVCSNSDHFKNCRPPCPKPAYKRRCVAVKTKRKCSKGGLGKNCSWCAGKCVYGKWPGVCVNDSTFAHC